MQHRRAPHPLLLLRPTAPTTSTTTAIPTSCASTREAEAMVTGHIHTGAITQDVTAGGEPLSAQRAAARLLHGRRSVFARWRCAGRRGLHLRWLGKYLPANATLPPPGDPNSLEPTYESAGPRRLWEDSHQSSGVIQDRIHLPGRIQLIAGGRYDSLRDHNYSAYASCSDPLNWIPTATDPNPARHDYRQARLAAAVRRHLQPDRESHALLELRRACLSLGPQAPFWTDNGSQFLAPFFTRQAEIGAKYEPGQRILLTAALFHMRAPFFYPKVSSDGICPTGGAGDLCFERGPRNAQRHRAERSKAKPPTGCA